jgi:hypothetical protein
MTRFNQMLVAAAILAGGLLTSVAPATATILTDSTRFYSGGLLDNGAATSVNYVGNWAKLAATAPTTGYGDFSLPNWQAVNNPGGTHVDVATHIDGIFYASTAGTWSFRVAVDAGWGGTLLVDGQEVQTRDTDMW